MAKRFDERLGVTSRIRPAPGRKRMWQATPTHRFPLPVIADHMCVDPNSRELVWLIEATIDLIEGSPALVRMNAHAPRGIDPHVMQREFRWASPLEVVTLGVPELLTRSIDPFTIDLPLTGFPQAASFSRRTNELLSDQFLEAIAREYLVIGRGYARAIASERKVSERTVISWVEKARQRGILTRVPSGSVGGQIIPKSQRSK